jgi:hypothetical protein
VREADLEALLARGEEPTSPAASRSTFSAFPSLRTSGRHRPAAGPSPLGTGQPGEPSTPFSGDYILRAYRAYDYDRNSDRFLMAKLDESETDQKELEVVVNWFDELKRLAPTPSGR